MKRNYVPPIARAIEIDTRSLIADSPYAGGSLQDFSSTSAFDEGSTQNFNNSDAFGSSNSLGNFKNYSAW